MKMPGQPKNGAAMDGAAAYINVDAAAYDNADANAYDNANANARAINNQSVLNRPAKKSKVILHAVFVSMKMQTPTSKQTLMSLMLITTLEKSILSLNFP